MQFEEKEEMPYKKKKESSVSKSEAKSKHKHQYDKTVIIGYWHKEFPNRILPMFVNAVLFAGN